MTRDKLKEKYKHLFSSSFGGFEVPDTWMYAIKQYLERTQWDWEKNGLRVSILQIKEKFGRLRVYTCVTDGREGLDDGNIAYAEAIVDHTCSKCGCMQKNIRYTEGYAMSYCEDCFKEMT
jgi:hypothetical protein